MRRGSGSHGFRAGLEEAAFPSRQVTTGQIHVVPTRLIS